MSRIKKQTLLFLSLCFYFVIQPLAEARPYGLNTPEARNLAHSIDQVLEAHTHKDIKHLMTLFHPDVRALWSNGKVMTTREELQQVYQDSFLGYRDFKGRWLPEFIDIEGDTAWMTGEMSWTAISIQSQQPIYLTVRSTYIFRKVNEQWLIVLEHSSHRRSD